MLHKTGLQPQEVLRLFSQLEEGLFAIRCDLPAKTYQVLLYKYQSEFFLLKNPFLLQQLLSGKFDQVSSEILLSTLEEIFEGNHYYPAEKEWIILDMHILEKFEQVEIELFCFEE